MELRHLRYLAAEELAAPPCSQRSDKQRGNAQALPLCLNGRQRNQALPQMFVEKIERARPGEFR